MLYAVAMLLFSLAGFAQLYALMRLPGVLPFNPQRSQRRLRTDLAFNTAISFTTNTNWQSYVPETTMSYLVQMAGLTVHNFVSAATGIALAIALIRGFARRVGQAHRQFLGRSHALHALRPAADFHRRRACSSSGRACRRTSTPTSSATTLEGAKQIDRPGPGRLAGSHQAARHQRRRLLQRQLRAPVREPERRSPTSSRWC